MNRELDHQAVAKQGRDDSRGGAGALGQQNVSDAQLDVGENSTCSGLTSTNAPDKEGGMIQPNHIL
jgi:hypothetical protein